MFFEGCKDVYEKGLQLRKKVHGEEFVRRAMESATDFNKDLQDLINGYVWGTIWARPGLDLKTRSLITIAMLIPQSRPEELKLHIRAALRNGVTEAELKELLIHATVYCGYPAVLDAFRVAQEVINEFKREQKSQQ